MEPTSNPISPDVNQELAFNGYKRYGATTDFKNFMGAPMPEFNDLPESIKQAWIAGISLPVEDINKLLSTKDNYDRNAISDGYHTFSELYNHRIALFLALAKQIRTADRLPANMRPWISELHFDGTKYTGYFIMGIGVLPGTQISYHLSLDWWHAATSFCDIRERAPEWDGHTPGDVVKRLLKLVNY